MEASTTARPRPSADEDGDRRDHAERETEAERAAVRKAARRETLTPEEERGALSFLLGDRKALLYGVKTTYETDEGEKDLTFVIKQLDGRLIDKIENRHRDRQTMQIDQIRADLDVVMEGLVAIEDETGATIDPRSEQFRTVNPEAGAIASAPDALAARFKEQLGLISGVGREIRRVSGWSVERVGQAERRLVDAAGG